MIGAGGAGLSTSYYLTRFGIDHVVLERGQIGNTWATERWDAFHLVNPNWAVRLPSFHYGGEAYGGTDPDGYLSRDETVDYLHRYAEHIDAPVQTGVEVCSLSPATDGALRLQLDDGRMLVLRRRGRGDGRLWAAQRSRLCVTDIRFDPPAPLGSLQECGPAACPALCWWWDRANRAHRSPKTCRMRGRRVYLSVSKAGRRPRRYRGYDSSWWMRELGHFDRTLDNVDEETRQRILSGSGGAGSGHVGGGKGGHDIYLRAFCRDGMTLMDRCGVS